MKPIFINIPVADLDKSMRFYQALGFTLNLLYTDENQKCLTWTASIYLMLQSRQFSNWYLEKQVIDPRNHHMPSFTLPVESIEQVNEMIENGKKAGGVEPVPAINEDFMFLRSIEDVDGYIWGIMYLDTNRFESLKTPN
jgi:predicted lactoylglutathione lyase